MAIKTTTECTCDCCGTKLTETDTPENFKQEVEIQVLVEDFPERTIPVSDLCNHCLKSLLYDLKDVVKKYQGKAK